MAEKNPLEMSDEELLKSAPSEFEFNKEPAEEEPEAADSVSEEPADDEQDASEDTETKAQQVENKTEESEEEETDSTTDLDKQLHGRHSRSADIFDNEYAVAEPEQEPETEPEKESKDKPVKQEADESDKQQIDYKAVYEQIFRPFKANGREVVIESPEDVVNLMQMGVGFNDKMRSLRPHMAILKTLEQNELLDDKKIRYLIDLSNGRKEAVTKLLKDGKIDPLDLDLTDTGESDDEDSSEYTPAAQMISEQELAIEQVLDTIRDSEHFKRTVQILGSEWDTASKRIIGEKPELIAAIHDHISEGIYDQIWNVVEKERMLGRLNDVSDIEAYKRIGKYLEENGGFSKPAPKDSGVPAASKPTVSDQQQDTQEKERGRAERKRRAAAPRSSTPKVKQEFNPLAMSDDEFEKVAGNMAGFSRN